MRILYIECGMGAAGDMLMSALYELLKDKQGFLDTMNALGLPGVRLTAEAGVTCGIAGSRIRVSIRGTQGTPEQHHHGGYTTPEEISGLLDALPLPEAVIANARSIYDAIAQAEAKAHRCPAGEVHFHEVGALDAAADIIGVCYALHLLQPERIVVSPIHVGSGTVRCAHGVFPVPAPATAALLAGIPIYGGTVEGELCTPTGAALLTHFADSFGPMPVMRTEQVGIGIGSKVFRQANCVRAFLGTDETPACAANGKITELICNIDDMTGEALAFACTQLLALGALDVYTIPGIMKKGRPGVVLTVLCDPQQKDLLARHILAQTATNGVRAREYEKYFLSPGGKSAETPWGTVRIKTAEGFGVVHAKPEHEDVAALARSAGVSYQTVRDTAMAKLSR